MAEWSIAFGCKPNALRATQVRILPGALEWKLAVENQLRSVFLVGKTEVNFLPVESGLGNKCAQVVYTLGCVKHKFCGMSISEEILVDFSKLYIYNLKRGELWNPNKNISR